MDKLAEKVGKISLRGDTDETNGSRVRRGGLQRRFAVIEAKLQPEGLTSKIGSSGRPVKLQSSFTRFSLKKADVFFMYDTSFEKLGLSMKQKFQTLFKIATQNNIPGAFAFDGRRLFTSDKWHKENDVQELPFEPKVTIRFLTQFNIESEEYYQMINIALNNIQLTLGQERIGKGYFLPTSTNRNNAPKGFGPTYFEMQNFKVFGGFATTLSRGTRAGGTVDLLLSIERINRVLNDNTVTKVYDRRSIDHLIGRDVITKHNNKTYRISDVKEMKIDDEIDLNGTKITYFEYFKTRYNITLQDRVQPFVLTKAKRMLPRGQKRDQDEAPESRDLTLTIPGELCCLCGFSDQEKSNMDLQSGLAGVLKREPRDRLQDIPSFCDWIKSGKPTQEMVRRWDLTIENRPIDISGRELPPLNVMSGGVRINEKQPDDWKFGRIQVSGAQGAKYQIDVVIVDRNVNNYNSFLDDLSVEIRNLRVNCRIGNVANCSPNEIEACLDDILKHCKPEISTMALVFVNDDRTYARVKSFTLQSGLLTQCITTRNGSNRNDKRRRVVASKSLLQVFAKFGCDPWTLDLKIKPTMIVGMDTYHSKTSKKSIHASVFSMNSTFTQYMSFVSSPKGRQEFHDCLAKNFTTALGEFRKTYRTLPLHLIVYRDGVGDSQLEFTKRYEVETLKPSIEQIYAADSKPLPQIIYVIVKKRISTKFFNSGSNPNPGTVVDSEIVKPNFYEFYLVSQRTLKGTATPTNYNILEDTKILNKDTKVMEYMPVNELQRTTYAMTHLYFNWQGTIRVPVPVHYAHRLAELLGVVHKGAGAPTINEKIRNRLFYL